MFNSYAFSQGSSAKRIEFQYQIASGSPIQYTLTNNLATLNRRTRTEISTEGYAVADSTPNIFLESTTGGTGAIILDRADSIQYLEWEVSGTTNSIVGGFDLSSETQLRDRFRVAGHQNLTAITFASETNPTNKSNSGLTLFYINDNDLRDVDLSGFKNFGEHDSSCTLRILNNPLTGITWPSTIYRMSIGMRNTSLSSVTLSGMPALVGLVIDNASGSQSEPQFVQFPENITSAATGTWDFSNTQVEDISFATLGSNFGGLVSLFNNPLTGITFPPCEDTVNSFFMRGCGLTSSDTIDLRPMTGMATSITVRNQSGDLRFGTSDRSVPFFYVTAMSQITRLDLSGFTNINTQFWCHTNSGVSAMTLGSWTNPFTQFYMMNHASLLELDVSPVTGLGGQVLFHNCPALTALTLPVTTNSISDFRFYSNSSHGYLDIKPLSGGSSDNISIQMQDNDLWDASISNHILHDLDNFGWTGGTLDMSGSTSGYDTSSGGYNGFTHYQSLTGKSWTIIMSGLTS